MHIYNVDAFTDKPYSGNPAGVCILDYPLSDEMMRRIIKMKMGIM
jgi:predicted PhzF superfamily epimerase YddE/YHI9